MSLEHILRNLSPWQVKLQNKKNKQANKQTNKKHQKWCLLNSLNALKIEITNPNNLDIYFGEQISLRILGYQNSQAKYLLTLEAEHYAKKKIHFYLNYTDKDSLP